MTTFQSRRLAKPTRSKCSHYFRRFINQSFSLPTVITFFTLLIVSLVWVASALGYTSLPQMNSLFSRQRAIQGVEDEQKSIGVWLQPDEFVTKPQLGQKKLDLVTRYGKAGDFYYLRFLNNDNNLVTNVVNKLPHGSEIMIHCASVEYCKNTLLEKYKKLPDETRRRISWLGYDLHDWKYARGDQHTFETSVKTMKTLALVYGLKLMYTGMIRDTNDMVAVAQNADGVVIQGQAFQLKKGASSSFSSLYRDRVRNFLTRFETVLKQQGKDRGSFPVLIQMRLNHPCWQSQGMCTWDDSLEFDDLRTKENLYNRYWLADTVGKQGVHTFFDGVIIMDALDDGNPDPTQHRPEVYQYFVKTGRRETASSVELSPEPSYFPSLPVTNPVVTASPTSTSINCPQVCPTIDEDHGETGSGCFVELSWNAVSNATEYRVYRNATSYGKVISTTYLWSSLPCNTTSLYKVQPTRPGCGELACPGVAVYTAK